MTDRPRLALRTPRSLTPEQLLDGHTHPTDPPVAVFAWIIWEDGVGELIAGEAIGWTRRAVHVRFGTPPHQHTVWVWAGAVQRRHP